MTIANEIKAYREQVTGKPVLVFLHGLLGSAEDWKSTIEELPNYRSLAIDLPGHGKNQHISVTGYDEACQFILDTIKHALPMSPPLMMVGYSLGARLAMYGLCHDRFHGVNIIGYIAEGGNIGLKSDQEKQLRLQNDQQWAKCFTHQPIKDVLKKWYEQKVFSSLSEQQRKELVNKRQHNSGVAVANMLVATSLAKQPYLLDVLQGYKHLIHYVCGEEDEKFYGLAQLSGLSFTCIEGAGHNAHQERPSQFSSLIQTQSKLFLETSKEIGKNHGKNDRND